jgi:hypothetical protein
LHDWLMTRREAIAVLASTATLPLMSGCTRDPVPTPSTPTEGDAVALLDELAESLLRLFPEGATSLGMTRGYGRSCDRSWPTVRGRDSSE